MESLAELLEDWHVLAYFIIAGIAAIVYVLHALAPGVPLLEKFFKEPKHLLIVILVISTITAARLEHLFANEEVLSAKRITNFNELFSELSVELGRAHDQIHVTSLRRESADRLINTYPNARQWYERLRRWPGEGINRRLYRVIATGTPDMAHWFKSECSKVAALENVTLRGFEWSAAVPAFNAVVFDSETSFLILSPPTGPVGETVAYRIEDKNFSSLMVKFVEKWISVGFRCAP